MSRQLDARAPRFAAAVTTVIVALVLITGNEWLALAQTLVFAVGAVNLRYAPYAVLFRTLVAPRLAPPVAFEAPEPVRFAQAVGLVFLTVATVAYFAGATAAGTVLSALALTAAFLNAAFGLCLGCELYLLARRLTARPT